MNEEQINVKIAELCGWKLRQEIDGEFSLIDPFGEKVSADWEPNTTLDSFYYALPSYCTDLNAMHEAEGTLMEPQQIAYADCLSAEVGAHEIQVKAAGNQAVADYFGQVFFRLANATAKQRAIAFLKTKGIQTTK
jgi:hypothetical protein